MKKCSVCRSTENILPCIYCKKPLCGLHRVGGGDTSLGYTCEGFWVDCRRPKYLTWSAVTLAILALAWLLHHLR
jgi:hypothetical protein